MLPRAIPTAASAADFDLARRRLSLSEVFLARRLTQAPLQKPLISAENFVACDDEDHFVDLIGGRDEFAGGF